MPLTPMTDPMHAALAGAGAWLVALAHGAAPVAVAALWQSAAIAIVLGLCLRFAPRLNLAAAERFALWAAAFAAVAVLPFLPALMRGAASGFAGNAPVNVPIGAPTGASAPVPWFMLPHIQIDERWALAIAALWLMASLARAVHLAMNSLHLRRLWNSAVPVEIAADSGKIAAQPGQAGAHLRALLAAASPARRPVTLCTTRELDRPSVIGFFAPRILIPGWLFVRLTPAELEHVILHEAEHLRRRDDWTNLMQKLALVLFPLNPALVWIEKCLCREREMACDEGVVRRTRAPHAYAASLTSLAERALARRCAQALSLGAFERRSELVRRVSSLLARKPALHPVAARTLVGVVTCGLLAASVELARCPQMVAFVPAAPSAAEQGHVAQMALVAPQGDGDRVYGQPTIAPGDSGFRAVRTRAILPAEPSAPAPALSASRPLVATRAKSVEASEREVASAEAASRAVQPVPLPFALFAKGWEATTRELLLSQQVPQQALKAEMPDLHFAASSQPEVVVLTSWEEVETSPRYAGIVADYDTGAAAQPQFDGAANRNGDESTVQIRVTRLIVFVAPQPRATTFNAPAHGPRPQCPTAFNSRQPPAPIAQSGWLVFEL